MPLRLSFLLLITTIAVSSCNFPISRPPTPAPPTQTAEVQAPQLQPSPTQAPTLTPAPVPTATQAPLPPPPAVPPTPLPVVRPPVFQSSTLSTCLNRTNIPEQDFNWVYIPVTADEMHSEEDYFFLAGQMIKSGVVDASLCPAGGLGATEGYANACGMALARDFVVQYQNAFNDSILQAWRDVGVPPILLRNMIRQESQFYARPWESTPVIPGVSGDLHVGLGHVTYVGARNALLWNQTLFQEICSLNQNNCDPMYVDSLAATLMDLVDASCPTCEHKIDLAKAQRSIRYQAEILLAYCNQTSQIVFNATKIHSSYVVDYATIWKLTLMNYNVGPQCVLDAVQRAYEETEGPIGWGNIVVNTDPQCERGAAYASRITQ